MQSNEVTGRRLDVNGGNLITFRGSEPKLSNVGQKRNTDQDMLEYVRAQEQKMRLEKLKWQENDHRVAALLKTTPVSSVTGPTIKPAPRNKVKDIPKQQIQESVKSTMQKEKPSPKHVAEVIEKRNRRASEWLHKEQQEVNVFKFV